MVFEAIILDMDGTLVNTEVLWKQAEQEMLAAYEREYDPVIHTQFLGMAVREFIPAVQQAYQLMDVDTQTLSTELRSRVRHLLETEAKPTRGAVELVEYIKENDIPCAIASNSSHPMIEATLSNQRWLDVIPMRFSSDDVPNAKPAPDLYLYAAKQLDVVPQKCLAIEDSLTGIRSATSAGMTCLAIPDHKLSNNRDYMMVTPHLFESLVEALNFIQSTK